MLEYFRRVNARMNRRYFGRGSADQRRYKQLIASRISEARVTLDLGAGSVDVAEFWKCDGQTVNTKGLLIALDIELARLKKNPNRLKLAADARLLPFKNGSIDLIVAENVFEHLEDPGPILTEASRVMKRGGALIFATPKKYSYISIVAALTPMAVHYWHAKLRDPAADKIDHCVTLYRLNTVKAVATYAGGANLAFSDCRTYVGDPCYTTFLPPPLHFLFIVLHKLAERFNFSRNAFGITMVGVLEKI